MLFGERPECDSAPGEGCRCPTVAAMPSRLKRSRDHTSGAVEGGEDSHSPLAWGLRRDFPDYPFASNARRAVGQIVGSRFWIAENIAIVGVRRAIGRWPSPPYSIEEGFVILSVNP
jgi:hypothetical protein